MPLAIRGAPDVLREAIAYATALSKADDESDAAVGSAPKSTTLTAASGGGGARADATYGDGWPRRNLAKVDCGAAREAARLARACSEPLSLLVANSSTSAREIERAATSTDDDDDAAAADDDDDAAAAADVMASMCVCVCARQAST